MTHLLHSPGNLLNKQVSEMAKLVVRKMEIDSLQTVILANDSQ